MAELRRRESRRLAARIVVVDDDESVGSAIRDVLAEDGFTVDSPGDAAAALPELLREAPDLVILDVNMPGMSGWELCSILRRQSANRERPDPLPDRTAGSEGPDHGDAARRLGLPRQAVRRR